MKNASQVAAALEDDLRELRDPRVLAGIQAFRLPTPAPIRLAWDYGKPGETFDGWLVFDDPGHGTGIAYCDQGFGPEHPWGLIFTDKPCPSMGMDSGWFSHFLDAYFDSFSSCDLDIWRVIRWAKTDPAREFITGELSWEEAWGIIERLRGEEPEYYYMAHHGIPY